MLLAVDIGNSTIRFGVFDLDNISYPICSFAISSDYIRTSDEYELLIKQFLMQKKFDNSIDCAVIASVVPSVTANIKTAVANISSSVPFIIGSGTRTGFQIRIDDPSEFGADIVCNAAAALFVFRYPIVIADFGTATTIAAINRNKELIGSVIIPGAGLSMKALTENAELINNVSFNDSKKLIGTNTEDSIASGVVNGNVFMIDGFIRNLREQLCEDGEKLTLVATGGYADLIAKNCRNKFNIVKDLTLIGAAVLYKNNRK